jgi:hypothetical protein
MERLVDVFGDVIDHAVNPAQIPLLALLGSHD